MQSLTFLISPLDAREIAATYMGARQVNPAVQFFVFHAGGFDNSTLQTKAANDLIDNYNCDVLVTVRLHIHPAEHDGAPDAF